MRLRRALAFAVLAVASLPALETMVSYGVQVAKVLPEIAQPGPQARVPIITHAVVWAAHALAIAILLVFAGRFAKSARYGLAWSLVALCWVLASNYWSPPIMQMFGGLFPSEMGDKLEL